MNGLVAIADSGSETGGTGSNTQNSSTSCVVNAAFFPGSGVENLGIRQTLSILNSCNALPDLWIARVSLRCHYHARTWGRIPADSLCVELASGAGRQDGCQIEIHSVDDGLSFGIAHAAVELQNFWATSGQHQSKIKESAIRAAVR